MRKAQTPDNGRARCRFLPRLRTTSLILGCVLIAPVGVVVVASVAQAVTTSTVSGTVTYESSGVANVCVYVETPDTSSVYQDKTNATGAYAISGVPAGNYIVQFDPSCFGIQSAILGLAGEYYESGAPNGTASSVAATVLDITTATTVNATLTQGAGLSGNVMDFGQGGPVCVSIYSQDDSWLYTGETDSQGNYDITGITLDSYTIEFDPSCGGTQLSDAAPQFYNDVPDGENATLYTFTAGAISSTPTLNAALNSGAMLEGTVTGPGGQQVANVCVLIFSPAPWDSYVYSTRSHLMGLGAPFFFAGLPADDWSVEFDPSCGGTQSTDLATAFYGGTGGRGGQVVAQASLPTVLDAQLAFAGATPSVVSNSLPDGTVGSSYSQTLGTTGGTPPYTWTSEGLPPGLSIAPNSGTIVGTPTTAGNFDPTFTATDSSAQSIRIRTTIPLNVDNAPPTTTTTTVAPVVPPAPIHPSPPPAPKPRIAITSTKLTLGAGLTSKVNISCSQATCSGTVQLEKKITVIEKVKVKVGKKTVMKNEAKIEVTVLASGSYRNLRKGKSALVELSPTAAGRTILKAAGAKTSLSETVVATVKGGSDTSRSVRVV